jgi:hypothetical protein
MKMKKYSCYGLLLLAVIGCGKSSSDTTSNASVAQQSSTQTNVAQANGAAQPVVGNGASTEPGEVVALFLDSLRRGDENAANSVLTVQAQTELAKTDYVIQPLGTPEGKYKIGRVGYVDGDNTTGLVECLWSEPSPVAGQPPIEMDIVCEVHKEPQGWRISGLAVKMTGTEETFVLDFENAQSLQEALEGASETSGTTSSAQSVATQNNQPQVGQLQLPGDMSLPSMPATTAQATFPSDLQVPTQFPQAPQTEFNPQLPTQIALPPSGTINR